MVALGSFCNKATLPRSSFNGRRKVQATARNVNRTVVVSTAFVECARLYHNLTLGHSSQLCDTGTAYAVERIKNGPEHLAWTNLWDGIVRCLGLDILLSRATVNTVADDCAAVNTVADESGWPLGDFNQSALAQLRDRLWELSNHFFNALPLRRRDIKRDGPVDSIPADAKMLFTKTKLFLDGTVEFTGYTENEGLHIRVRLIPSGPYTASIVVGQLAGCLLAHYIYSVLCRYYPQIEGSENVPLRPTNPVCPQAQDGCDPAAPAPPHGTQNLKDTSLSAEPRS